MNNDKSLVVFENKKVRRFYDEETEVWYFSVVDIIHALTESSNPRDYWFKMKLRVKSDDGFELSTICRQLKLKASDGKMRVTDVSNVEGLFRIIQSIPSPKAEPFKQWLAKVGYERVQEINDPSLSMDSRSDGAAKVYSPVYFSTPLRVTEANCRIESGAQPQPL